MYRQVAVRLNHVTLAARDVECSARFYTRLGLTQIVANYADYARLVAPEGGTTLSLHCVEHASSEPTASIHFEVDDVDRSVEELKRAGFTFVCDPVDQPYLWREAILLDPNGHRIFIYHAGENRLDPPWRLHSADVRGGLIAGRLPGGENPGRWMRPVKESVRCGTPGMRTPRIGCGGPACPSATMPSGG